MLWPVADLAAAEEPNRAVAAHVEANPAEPLTAPELTAAASASHDHLTRCSTPTPGTPRYAHVRRRRLERAHRLLRPSTLPVPTVAAAVGFGDLQSFNQARRLRTPTRGLCRPFDRPRHPWENPLTDGPRGEHHGRHAPVTSDARGTEGGFEPLPAATAVPFERAPRDRCGLRPRDVMRHVAPGRRARPPAPGVRHWIGSDALRREALHGTSHEHWSSPKP